MARHGKNSLQPKMKKTKKSEIERKKKEKIKNWICGLISVIIIAIGLLVIKAYYFSNDEGDEAPTSTIIPRMDHIIRHFIDITNQIQEMVFQMSTFLMDDPFVELMKNGLRPIQERVTSLRTQTSQYEKMERIPGGPTHFMATSLKELDSIIDEQLFRLSLRSMAILADVSRKVGKILQSNGALVQQNSGLDNKDIATTMTLENLTLATLAIEKSDEALLAQNITLEETMNVLNRLASLYEEYDSSFVKAGEMTIQLGYNGIQDIINRELADEEYHQLLPIMDELRIKRTAINEEKVKNEKYYRLFAVLNCQLRQNKAALINRMLHYNEDEVRRPFLQLHDMIVKDARNLKTRINNLQFKYAKRNLEL